MQPLQILILPSGPFNMREEHLAQIRATVPDAIIRLMPGSDATPADIAAADVIFGWPKPQWVAEAPRVRWVQLPSAGADGWKGIRPDILLTKSSGVFGIPIAEWIVGCMLMLTRNLHLYRDQQKQAVWEELPGAVEVYGSTVGIVGLGDLGREAALRLKALGCRTLGVRRRAGLPSEGIDEMLTLDEVIPQADFLVLTLPGTPETDGMISAERIGRMRRGAYLINAGRGSTVDEPALIAALQSGHLAGAALDVTAVEPLPAESPLWRMPQVVLTPHVAGRSKIESFNRRTDIFCRNLRHLLAGETLHNLVDREAGY